jgi:hypothetical protein
MERNLTSKDIHKPDSSWYVGNEARPAVPHGRSAAGVGDGSCLLVV